MIMIGMPKLRKTIHFSKYLWKYMREITFNSYLSLSNPVLYDKRGGYFFCLTQMWVAVAYFLQKNVGKI